MLKANKVILAILLSLLPTTLLQPTEKSWKELLASKSPKQIGLYISRNIDIFGMLSTKSQIQILERMAPYSLLLIPIFKKIYLRALLYDFNNLERLFPSANPIDIILTILQSITDPVKPKLLAQFDILWTKNFDYLINLAWKRDEFLQILSACHEHPELKKLTLKLDYWIKYHPVKALKIIGL